MGLPPDEARATVRVSLGPCNTAAEIDDLVIALGEEVASRPDRREAVAASRGAR